ncbi:MAG: hypothetical protein JWM16_1427 [Verrucomicrobiales bacterium]|nr:hypothetical protein [Verrucomicrobiales bacterium]
MRAMFGRVAFRDHPEDAFFWLHVEARVPHPSDLVIFGNWD